MNISYICYLSGTKFTAPALGQPAPQSQLHPMHGLHPLLTVSPKDLATITEAVLATGSANHLHLIAWLVQLGHFELVIGLDTNLHKRFPDLGPAFVGFFVPWLMEIHSKLCNGRTSSKHGNRASIPPLPKMALTPANLAPLLDSNSKVTEQREVIKRQLITWAQLIRENLNLVTLKEQPRLTTHADVAQAELEAEKQLAKGKPRSLRLLVNYLRACLDRRVMDVELKRAVESLYNIETISFTQIKHLRQLVLDFGMTEFVDQEMAYQELLALCNKHLADRAGLSSLLTLQGSRRPRTDSRAIADVAAKPAGKASGFNILPPTSAPIAGKVATPLTHPKATPASNKMLAAIAARAKNKQEKGK